MQNSELKSILIADDTRSHAQALESILTEARILNPIHIVSNGVDAIDYISGKGEYGDRIRFSYPVILFLDLVMPWQSGMNTLDWIRNHAEYQDFAVVVMTGIGNIDEIRRAYQRGAHSFLVKPPVMEDVMNLVNGLPRIRPRTTAEGHILDFIPTTERKNR